MFRIGTPSTVRTGFCSQNSSFCAHGVLLFSSVNRDSASSRSCIFFASIVVASSQSMRYASRYRLNSVESSTSLIFSSRAFAMSVRRFAACGLPSSIFCLA